MNFDQTTGLPTGPLIQAADGDFYGVAGITVFRMTTNGDLSVVAVFNQTNSTSGNAYAPNSPLVQGKDGNFYGTTEYGLGNQVGTVFKMTPQGQVTTLTSLTHGYLPTSGLTLGNDGNFYGTTSGRLLAGFGDATVFKITSAGALTTLAYFSPTNDADDTPGLTLGSDGNLYGTTRCGPALTNGTVFKVTPSGTLTILARFTNGAYPLSQSGITYTGLVQAGDGNFYGTLYCTVPNPGPALYQMTPMGVITTITNAPSIAGPILGSDGNIYGASVVSVYRLVLPPVFQSVTKTGTSVTLTWSTAIGQSYQPQFTANLLSTNWTSLGAPITATNLTLTVSDSPGTNTQRFYRVQLLP